MTDNKRSPRCTTVVAGILLLFSLAAEAWICPAALPSLGITHSVHSSNDISSRWRTVEPFGPSRANVITLFYSSEFGDHKNEYSNSTSPTSSSSPSSAVLERLKINGVSVSPKGFHVLLESTTTTNKNYGKEPENTERNGIDDSSIEQEARTTKNDDIQDDEKSNLHADGIVLPLKMTNDPADAYAATSPESLTLCQLLSGVDMAGAILPPELLGNIVVSHIEDKLESMYDDDEEDDEEAPKTVFTPILSPIESKLWEYLQNLEALGREQQAFAAPGTISSSSSKVQIPQVTLDQLTLVPNQRNTDDSSAWLCRLECALPEWKERIVVDVKADLLASLAYNYDPEASPLFTCVALALRYKAPIVLLNNQDNRLPYWSTRDELDRDFPQRTTLRSFQQQSTRVTQNIEKGFEIHKLTGALQIAMRLGDTKAAEKIRAKLDEYDSMDDLPTTAADDGETGNDDRPLDDLENNILQ